MACKIDLGKQQLDKIHSTVNQMVSSDTAPHTIVGFVSTEIDFPDVELSALVSATNWCLVTCISSCVYDSALFTPPSTYIYDDKPTLYACVDACFPVIVPPPTTPAAGGGGGAAAPTPVAADNLAAWQADQIKNVDNQLIDALDWLDDILDRAFLGLAITVASYDAYIEILVLHLSDATKADITKVIGEVIKAISKILKIAVDKAMALKDKALAALTNTTELPNYGPPHIHFTKKHEVKATHGALTKIQGYFTDDIDNVGKYIEQIGEFLNDVTDIRFDLQEISFSFASLDAQIAEFVSLIDHTFERIDETIVAADTTKEGLLQKYEEQAMNKLNDIAESTGFNDLIEEGTAFANTIDKSMASISDQVADAGIAIVPSSLRSLAAAPPVGGIA